MALEVRCGVCGSTIMLGNKSSPVSEIKNGIAYLVPETVRHEDKLTERLEKLKAAGVNVDKLKTLMGGDTSVASLFDDDDPIVKELSNGGYIRNPELFRRWITAQTWGLIKSPLGWTRAVKNRYDIRYVLKQTKREVELLAKLSRKGLSKDKRFSFFTMDDLKSILIDLAKVNYSFTPTTLENVIEEIKLSNSYTKLLRFIESKRWYFDSRTRKYFKPRAWLNCFKGAGAYYTLQNLIRTHGLIIPGCKDMQNSLDCVEKEFNKIVSFEPKSRRWDILMSLLVKSVYQTRFELKY